MSEPQTRSITIVVDEAGQPMSFPTIYDLASDTRRPVTQADVDRLLEVQAAFGEICRTTKKITGKSA